jgi:hypothetical protein
MTNLLLQENLMLKRRLYPHPAQKALTGNPDLPTTILSCSVCGTEWPVPINSSGEPDITQFTPGILTCPVCGTHSELIPIFTQP